MDVCNLCGKAACLMCQRCKDTYCSTNCQILDWKVHKTMCFAMPPLIPVPKFINQSLCYTNTKLNESLLADGDKIANLRRPHESEQLGDCRSKSKATRSPLSPPRKLNTRNDEIEKPFSQDAPLKKDAMKPLPPVKECADDSIKSDRSGLGATGWTMPFSCPDGVFFKTIVQYIDENDRSLIWVTEMKYDTALQKLMLEINRNISSKTSPCKADEIYEGALVAAPFVDLYYRAKINKVILSPQKALVTLIDYGNQIEIPFKKLRPPIPIMRNLKAYAFCIRYNVEHSLDLEDVIKIRSLGPEECGSVLRVEMKQSLESVPQEFPHKLLSKEAMVVVRKVLSGGKYAILQFASTESTKTNQQKMNELLNSEAGIQMDFNLPPTEGAHVAARTSKGWRRAMVLGNWKNGQVYLVYLLDEGSIKLVNQLKKIPNEFIEEPMQTFCIENRMKEEDFLVELRKFSIRLLENDSTTKDKRFPCAIYDENVKVADIFAFTFSGRLDQIGVDLWHEPLADSSVYIVRVKSHHELLISSICTKEYGQMFTDLAEKCAKMKPEEAIKNALVLATADGGSTYFRAKVLSDQPTSSGQQLNVVCIDLRCTLTVKTQLLRKPSTFIRLCPVFVSKVKLNYLENIPSPFEDNQAVYMLEQSLEVGTEFSLKYDPNGGAGVELLFKTAGQESFNKQLLPLLFERTSTDASSIGSASAKSVAEKDVTSNQTPSETDSITFPNLNKMQITPTKIFTLDDLKVRPIPCGEDIEIMVLDSSAISKGYLTGCHLGDRKFLDRLENVLLPQIAKYCSCPHLPEYAPKKEEICLAVFEEDGGWYRAVCVEQLDKDMFTVMFLDYGNSCKVKKKDIRQITSELMFPSNANLCFIDGFEDNTDEEKCKRVCEVVLDNPVITCTVNKLDKDSYLIGIVDL